jgi:4-hydroxybenzoate polyprenyltransferase
LGIGLLWLSFLFYLESRHNDELRLKVNKYLWLVPFIFALFLLPAWMCLSFAFVSYCYTSKKKNKFFGATAPFWRGLQNGIIAIGFNLQIAVLAFALIFVRNLIADFRDAHDDEVKNIKTIPVLLGIGKDQVWAFYVHMALVVATTLIWSRFSFLSIYMISVIVVLQIVSYPLTPRLSNPKYLNIWS